MSLTDHEDEPDWTITLRRRPARDSRGNPDDDTGKYEVICRECGDDPALDYREVPAEFRQIRGPYPLMAASPRSSSTASPMTEPRRHDRPSPGNRENSP